jgi:hypothetical protein
MASDLYGMVVSVFCRNIYEGPRIKVFKFWLQHIESWESKPKAFNTPLLLTCNSQIKLTPMKKNYFSKKSGQTLTPCFSNHCYGGKLGHLNYTKNQTPIVVIFLSISRLQWIRNDF